jgi:hypothetical protein
VKYKKGWIALLVLAVLTPLGLLALGSAWGEWDVETLEERSGTVPEGLEEAQQQRPDAPFPDYELPGLEGNRAGRGIGTILSALIGVGLTAGTVILIGKAVRGGGNS